MRGLFVLGALFAAALPAQDAPSRYKARRAEKTGPDGAATRAAAERKSGEKLLAEGKTEEALAVLTKAETLYDGVIDGYVWGPEDQRYPLLVGKALLALGRKDEAALAFSRSVALADPAVKGAKVEGAELLENTLPSHIEVGKEGLVAAARQKYVLAVKNELVGYPVDRPAKEFELPRLGGGTVKLSALRGKVVLLNFWGTW